MSYLSPKYLLLTLFTVLPSLIFAQITYQKYFNETYRWYEVGEYANFGGSGSPCMFLSTDTQYSFFHVTGVDTMNGKSWYQVHLDQQTVHECSPGNIITDPPVADSGVTLRFREDSTGKIWILPANYPEYLAYDFGGPFGLGDTLWMYNHLIPCKIGQIDTVLFGGDPRAKYWCECDSTSGPAFLNYVIEGVGTSKGFENFFDLCYIIADAQDFMVCAKKDLSTLEINSSHTCGRPDHVILGVEEPALFALDMGWNEMDEAFWVNNLPSNFEAGWTLYDLQGRTLMHGNSLEASTRLPGLSSGMYLFVIENNGLRSAKRFAKF